MPTITDQDNGKEITVKANDVLEITLKWSPSSGYTWQDIQTSAGKLIGVRQDAVSLTPGASAVASFRFLIAKSGSISMSYARPWDDASPAKWFHVDIKVT